MASVPVSRAGVRGWRHDDGTPGVVFETFDALDLDDPFGPRKVHLMLPEAPTAEPLPLVVLQDGDTTFWPGGVGHASWNVARTVARLQAAGRLPPIAIAAVCPRVRDEEYTHVDWRDGQAPWGGLDRYAAWTAGSLVPWLREAHPELDRRREAVAVAGSSHGGLAAFRIATSYPETFGIAGCLSPSFFSGLDDLDRGLRSPSLEASDLVVRAAPVLADPSRRPRLWIDWGMRRDGGHHNAIVEALAALRGAEMAELLERRFGARITRIDGAERGPRDADVVVLVDRSGGHDERAWEHRAGLFLETFFGR